MKPSSIVLSSFVIACGPSVPIVPDDVGGTSAADGDDGTFGASQTESEATAVTTLTTAEVTSAGSQDTNGPEGTTDSVDGGGFIEGSDDGGVNTECDIWIDDCPPGQKCMPWANDGGSSWNATKCSPLAEDPKGVGESCTIDGSGVDGVDDCEARAMCWDVDPETDMGTCIAMCTGSEANPTCDDPCTTCPIHSDGVLILCLRTCDPLLQDCYEGQACYPIDDTFTCAPDVSAEIGALGDPCEFLNVCDPGLFCANPDSVPDCAGASGCCASFCDVLAEDSCAAIPGGVECIPWFDEGTAPPCVSGVIGACVLPQ